MGFFRRADEEKSQDRVTCEIAGAGLLEIVITTSKATKTNG
jgi:hypothetical protein